jgi:cysteine desulfurase/selenocysteine lyase
MYAGTGIGVLYGKRDWLERMPPCRYGGGMVDRVGLERTTFAGVPHRFEAGTVHIAGVAGLAAAIDYLGDLGREEVVGHEEGLTRYALDRLSGVDRCHIYGAPARRSGIIPFNLEGIHHYDAAAILDGCGIALRSGQHCAEPVMAHYGTGGMMRASFAVYNTEEDVDRLVRGLEAALGLLG